jgi:hypothetical protein
MGDGVGVVAKVARLGGVHSGAVADPVPHAQIRGALGAWRGSLAGGGNEGDRERRDETKEESLHVRNWPSIDRSSAKTLLKALFSPGFLVNGGSTVSMTLIMYNPAVHGL